MIGGQLPGVLAWAGAMLAVASVALRADRRVLARAEVGEAASSFSRWLPKRAFARVGRVEVIRKWTRPEQFSERLALARRSLSLEEAVGLKVTTAVAAACLGILSPWPGPLLSPVLALTAFHVPDLVWAAEARRRLGRADQELPQLLDLLGAASAAGLSGPIALRRSIEATQGPLAEELETVLRAVELGGRWRDQLRSAAERLGLPDLRRAVAALTRTEALGTPLSEAMTELAGQVREARRAAAGERARKAPVKMLFPLVFLILPAFLLLTVVPVLITTLRSIR